MGRLYNRTLECGCLVSPDSGGGCIPCHYSISKEWTEEDTKCKNAWDKWKQSTDYLKEVVEEYNNW